MKTFHLLMVPFTGLGLYNGFRGNRWLRNRIKIFEQFVVPSLLNQTNRDFTLWVCWRYEERSNTQVSALKGRLEDLGFKVVFTYAGIPFWDDKYPDEEANVRLLDSIHGSMSELINIMGEADTVLMTIQPSDDCYITDMVQEAQDFFRVNSETKVYGYAHGYVMDYTTKRLAEWNPKTTPPFYTISFPREVFVDPLRHAKYTGPYKSHEYVKDFLPALYREKRGMVVGTHGENISTIFNHPYAGREFGPIEKATILHDFGLDVVPPLKLKISLRKILMRKLPHGWQRKLRYWLGERFWARLYKFLRN